MLEKFESRIKNALAYVTLEPVIFLTGTCHWSMQVYMEVVQMNKICLRSLGLSKEICDNLTAHPEENIRVQKEYSIFALQNSLVLSIFGLFFVLFIGAWSDKYGRKIPLVMAATISVLWSGGYLLNSWQESWPLELIYVATFVNSLGGGAQGLIALSVAYISDVTPVETRTSRVSTAMSLRYFGGPLGSLIGAVAIQLGGINLAIGIAFLTYLISFFYTIFFIQESHGPFAVAQLAPGCPKYESSLKKEDVTVKRMVLDLFSWRRVVESFKTAFKKREGYDRGILLAVIFSNMTRRVAKAYFMYMFVRRVLDWDAAIYSYWTSYHTLTAAIGSLVLVPLLARMIAITDPMFIVLGSLATTAECCCYGFVSGISTSFFIWVGPLAGLLSNASMIAQKSLSTKLVSSDEKGRVSAVMSATQSVMPSVGYALYAPIYHLTVKTFPAAQFFVGASLCTIIMIVFLAIHLSNIIPDVKPYPDNEKEAPKCDKNTEELKLKESKKPDPIPDIKKRIPVTSSTGEEVSIPSDKAGPIYLLYCGANRSQGSEDQLGGTENDSVKRINYQNGSVPCYENMSDAEILKSEKNKDLSSSTEFDAR